MKTAAQLFTSSYLQPNNIDTELSRVARGALRTRKRGKKGEERARKKWKKKFGKIYDFLFVLALIISPLASMCSSSICKKSSSSATQHIFSPSPHILKTLGGVRLQWEFLFFSKKKSCKVYARRGKRSALRMWSYENELRAPLTVS